MNTSDLKKYFNKNSKTLMIVGIVLVIFGFIIILGNTGQTYSGDFAIRRARQQDANFWVGIGTIILIAGGGLVLGSKLYKNHTTATSLSNSIDVKKDNKVEKMKELKEMLDNNLISKDEYEEKKKKILDSM